MMGIRFASLAVAGMVASSASAGLLFSTGFEAAEGYTSGSQLASNANWSGSGQDTAGWGITNTTVGGSGAKNGSQWILANAPTAAVPTRWQWTNAPVTDFSVNSTVVGSADIKLVSPASGSVTRSTVAGLQMYTAAVDLICQIGVLVDAENTYGLGAGRMVLQLSFGDATGVAYDLGASNVLNTYVNLGLAVNFQTNTVTGYYNGVALPDVGSAGGVSDFHDLDMIVGRSTTTTGGTAARAGFDNYSVSTVPTPGAIALLGVAGLASRRRRA